MKEPLNIAHGIPASAAVAGNGERFSGYAVLGLPFSSGHVLALRHVEASSIGPAYTSVWCRHPDGRWVFHQDAPAEQSCPRYFGAAISENTTGPIHIAWMDTPHHAQVAPPGGPELPRSGLRRFRITVGAPGEIVWHGRLVSTPATSIMNAALRALPARGRESPAVLAAMGAAARWMLGTGPINLTGHTPNGQVFTGIPRRIWRIVESRATIRGVDMGAPAPLDLQATLGDFRIPQRGIFAVFTSVMENSARVPAVVFHQ